MFAPALEFKMNNGESSESSMGPLNTLSCLDASTRPIYFRLSWIKTWFIKKAQWVSGVKVRRGKDKKPPKVPFVTCGRKTVLPTCIGGGSGGGVSPLCGCLVPPPLWQAASLSSLPNDNARWRLSTFPTHQKPPLTVSALIINVEAGGS